jgi:LPS export ABC transporter protein LptC
MKTMRILKVILLILPLCGLLWLAVRPSVKNITNTVDRIAEGAYATGEDFSFTRNKNGRVECEIKAKQAEYSENKQIANFKDVEATFFDEKDRTVRVTGKKGKYNSDTQNLELFGEVRVVTSLGYSMSTEGLIYTNADRTIRSTSPAFIKGDGVAMNSEQVVFYIDDEKADFVGDVKSTLWNPRMLDDIKGRFQ